MPGKHLTSAQVMILWFMSLSPAIQLCANSSEPGASFSFWVSLSLCPSPVYSLSLSLSLSLKNKHLKIFLKIWSHIYNKMGYFLCQNCVYFERYHSFSWWLPPRPFVQIIFDTLSDQSVLLVGFYFTLGEEILFRLPVCHTNVPPVDLVPPVRCKFCNY